VSQITEISKPKQFIRFPLLKYKKDSSFSIIFWAHAALALKETNKI
jgi:hypothetical protein